MFLIRVIQHIYCTIQGWLSLLSWSTYLRHNDRHSERFWVSRNISQHHDSWQADISFWFSDVVHNSSDTSSASNQLSKLNEDSWREQRSFMCNKLPLKQSITEHSHAFQKCHAGMQETGGTQQTNVSQYVKSISNNFLYALEAFFG